MTRVAIYLDEDASKRLFSVRLSSLVTIASTGSAGMFGASDEDQLEFATRQRMIVATYNRQDFARIHTRLMLAGLHHSGILILFQERYSIGEELRRLQRFIALHTAESMLDRLEYITSPDFAI